MRQLPFPDRSFDVVVSSWAVHNLEAKTERTQALTEMLRVLRPGGVTLLTDIVNRNEYMAAFRQLGCLDVRLIVLSNFKDKFFSIVSFGTFQPATVLATKP